MFRAPFSVLPFTSPAEQVHQKYEALSQRYTDALKRHSSNQVGGGGQKRLAYKPILGVDSIGIKGFP